MDKVHTFRSTFFLDDMAYELAGLAQVVAQSAPRRTRPIRSSSPSCWEGTAPVAAEMKLMATMFFGVISEMSSEYVLPSQ